MVEMPQKKYSSYHDEVLATNGLIRFYCIVSLLTDTPLPLYIIMAGIANDEMAMCGNDDDDGQMG